MRGWCPIHLSKLPLWWSLLSVSKFRSLFLFFVLCCVHSIMYAVEIGLSCGCGYFFLWQIITCLYVLTSQCCKFPNKKFNTIVSCITALYFSSTVNLCWTNHEPDCASSDKIHWHCESQSVHSLNVWTLFFYEPFYHTLSTRVIEIDLIKRW